jgi:hypothetical protein
MYVNGKRIHVDTIPGIGEGRIKENGGGGDIFDVRAFVSDTMYPLSEQKLKRNKLKTSKKYSEKGNYHFHPLVLQSLNSILLDKIYFVRSEV